jgi:hypothetical protein
MAVLALGAALLLGGCQSNSHTCTNGRCHVTVSGAGQTVEVDDNDVTVSDIAGDAMTVQVGGSAPTVIRVGQSSQVGPVTIKVTSVDGDKVKFDLQ